MTKEDLIKGKLYIFTSDSHTVVGEYLKSSPGDKVHSSRLWVKDGHWFGFNKNNCWFGTWEASMNPAVVLTIEACSQEQYDRIFTLVSSLKRRLV